MRLATLLVTTEDLNSSSETAVDAPETQDTANEPDEQPDPAPEPADASEQTADTVDLAPSDTQDEQVQVDESADRINEAHAENAQGQVAIEEAQAPTIPLENAANTLDEIQASANNMIVAEGVLSPVAASVISQTMESIFTSLRTNTPAMPTNEAFRGTWTKKDATRLTMEAIVSSKKDIVSKILSTLKNVVNSVMSFLTGLLKNRMLLEAHIKRLIAKAKANQDKVDFESDVVSGRFSHGLQFKDKSDMSSASIVLMTASRSVEYYEDVNKAIQEIRDGRTPANALMKYDSVYSDCGTTATIVDGKTVVGLGAFPNAMSLYNAGSDANPDIRFVSNKDVTVKQCTESAALSGPVILKLLESALEVVKKLRKVESTTDTLTAAIKGILKKVEMEYNAFRAVLGSETHRQQNEAYKTGLETQRLLTKLVSKLPNTIFSSVKYIGDYAIACLNNLK